MTCDGCGNLPRRLDVTLKATIHQIILVEPAKRAATVVHERYEDQENLVVTCGRCGGQVPEASDVLDFVIVT